MSNWGKCSSREVTRSLEEMAYVERLKELDLFTLKKKDAGGI